MPENLPLVIIGGNSLVAPYLMQRLSAAGRTADVISRGSVKVPEGFTFTTMDLDRARNWIAPENAVVISLLPLWLLVRYLPRFIGVQAIIALGSTNLFGKAANADSHARAAAFGVETAERSFADWCPRSNVHGILLRPTMIYDGMRDTSIARLARFIRRFRFLPLATPAKGLRQPIHADDVAGAICGAIGTAAVYGKVLNIAGGEILSYRAMTERIFAALGLNPRLLMLPEAWLEKGFHVALQMHLLREASFSGSVFRHMNEDLVFDTEEGLRLLRYQPRRFAPAFDE